MRPSAPISECTGNSSKITSTTGAVARTCAAWTSAEPGKTRSETSDTTRNSTTKTTGAGPSTVRNVRAAGRRT